MLGLTLVIQHSDYLRQEPNNIVTGYPGSYLYLRDLVYIFPCAILCAQYLFSASIHKAQKEIFLGCYHPFLFSV